MSLDVLKRLDDARARVWEALQANRRNIRQLRQTLWAQRGALTALDKQIAEERAAAVVRGDLRFERSAEEIANHHEVVTRG